MMSVYFQPSICSVMSVLEAHITAMSKEDLTAHIQDLQKFFLDGLNFRFLYCEVIRFTQFLHKIVNDYNSSSYYYYCI
jgi:hypothetical protein